jgi:hypothetical protein
LGSCRFNIHSEIPGDLRRSEAGSFGEIECPERVEMLRAFVFLCPGSFQKSVYTGEAALRTPP